MFTYERQIGFCCINCVINWCKCVLCVRLLFGKAIPVIGLVAFPLTRNHSFMLNSLKFQPSDVVTGLTMTLLDIGQIYCSGIGISIRGCRAGKRIPSPGICLGSAGMKSGSIKG